ncbi:hypothetical protein LX32DRAFT_643048 [Colletotrichum zoysiae]|uniref:Uncharacterized protein n=1 Tax=Colletotrichum zoysiae TaxID=1216348 RepID=A0AAD9HBM8_9PEZI|nr:hypothetical protein LX32DRAFT_643048 [Colletotrichum zoysiae]
MTARDPPLSRPVSCRGPLPSSLLSSLRLVERKRQKPQSDPAAEKRAIPPRQAFRGIMLIVSPVAIAPRLRLA